jgi:hypothetical protein
MLTVLDALWRAIIFDYDLIAADNLARSACRSLCFIA